VSPILHLKNETYPVCEKLYRGREVDETTGCRLEDRGMSSGRIKNFPMSIKSRPTVGPTKLPITLVAEAFYQEVKRLQREANHSPLATN
jgi:hypothetical protein